MERIPYRLGRLYAVCEDIIRAAGRGKPEESRNARRTLASKDPGTVARTLTTATEATADTGRARCEWYENALTDLAEGIDKWPDTLTAEEQSDWWLGFYHERGHVKENRPAK